MELEELRRLVDQVRQRKMEPDAVEVKAAHVDTPKVYDSLSAFGNRPGAGVLLLGLDEKQGFRVVGVGNAQKVQSEIANWARDQMEPPRERSISFGSRGDPCCSRKCLPLKMIPASRLVVRT